MSFNFQCKWKKIVKGDRLLWITLENSAVFSLFKPNFSKSNL